MKPETAGKVKYGVWGLIVGGHHCNDHRLCLGRLVNQRHFPKDI